MGAAFVAFIQFYEYITSDHGTRAADLDEPLVARAQEAALLLIQPRLELAHSVDRAEGAIAAEDARVPCVVGPTPYYKVWNLNSTMLLRTAGGCVARAPL